MKLKGEPEVNVCVVALRKYVGKLIIISDNYVQITLQKCEAG